MIDSTSDLVALAENFQAGRQGVPPEVLSYLWSFLNKKKHPIILDVGCGTGIPTRQMALRGASVYGVDINPEMIRVAIENSPKAIPYAVAPSKKLPFATERFDAVTAFSAFHWFADAGSIKEMQRVLHTNGIIFTTNKKDTSTLHPGIRAILKTFIGKEIPSTKVGYRPIESLERYGFHHVMTKTFSTSEFYSIQQMLSYVQTLTAWTLIPEEKREDARSILSDYFMGRAVDDMVERAVDISVIVGFKSKSVSVF